MNTKVKTETEKIQGRVIQILRELGTELPATIMVDPPDVDAPLDLDSLGVLKLIVALEHEFSISFEDEDLTNEVVGSVSAIAAFIEGKAAGTEEM